MRNQSNRAATILALLYAFLLASLANDVSGDEKEDDDAAKALEGEWEVVEMIFKGTKQDFGGKPERMKFLKDDYRFANRDDDGKYRFGLAESCRIRPNEIDLTDKFSGEVTKVLYQIKSGRLWICWDERPRSERPLGFGAVADPNLTLRILKRVEKPSK